MRVHPPTHPPTYQVHRTGILALFPKKPEKNETSRGAVAGGRPSAPYTHGITGEREHTATVKPAKIVTQGAGRVGGGKERSHTSSPSSSTHCHAPGGGMNYAAHASQKRQARAPPTDTTRQDSYPTRVGDQRGEGHNSEGFRGCWGCVLARESPKSPTAHPTDIHHSSVVSSPPSHPIPSHPVPPHQQPNFDRPKDRWVDGWMGGWMGRNQSTIQASPTKVTKFANQSDNIKRMEYEV